MINRILIRIKVVQLLYSYLLLEKHFMLETQPTPPTKEKRFAYALYLDMLVLIVKAAESIEKRGGERPLYENKFIRNLLADEKIKSLLLKYRGQQFPYEAAVDGIVTKIKESGLYKNFLKKDIGETGADLTVWRDIFNTIIASDLRLNSLFTQTENFTLRGVDRMKDLMSVTFTNFLSSNDSVTDALKQLRQSLGMSRELYFRLLTLPVELTRLRELEIDEARHKYITTDEDLNPNMRFVENQLVALIAADAEVNEFVDKNKLAWLPEDRILLTSLLRRIKESDLYAEYMDFPATDLHNDCEFWRNVYKQVIFPNPDFLEALEDKSVFWNDDVDIIGTFMLKTLKRFEESVESGESAVLAMYKDEEDARFGAELFTATVRNKDIYRDIINSVINTTTWDTDRLAFMDVVILLTAVAEILCFPKIPTQVSINEYIELAKSYSTPKSGLFVHGVLGGVVAKLREDGRLTKE